MLAPDPDPVLLQFDGKPCAWQGAVGPFALRADRALRGSVAAPPLAPPPPPADAPRAVRRGRGWIDACEREFELTAHAGHQRLDAGPLSVAWSNDGRRVWCPVAPADGAGCEAAAGIGLVAALAARGVFCLHASAVRWRGGCIAFSGASGAGKSTLAGALDALRLAPRVADDVLPLDRDGLAWAAFPQWKLPPEAWWPARDGALRLEALVLLARGPSAHCTALPASQAVQALVGATAGARAFPEPVLAEHLAMVARWSRGLPVWRLTVPDRPGDLAGAARAAFDVLDAQPWA